MLWLVWLQLGPILGSGGQIASDLRVWSGQGTQVWVGYRAHRKGQTHLYIHHLDTAGVSTTPLSGWSLTAGEGGDVQIWDGLVGGDGQFYGAADLGDKILLFSLSPAGLWGWRHEQPYRLRPVQLRVLPGNPGGLVLGLLSETHLEIQVWTQAGEKVATWQVADSVAPKRHLQLLPGGPEGFWVLWESFFQNSWRILAQKLSWRAEALAPLQTLSGLPHTIYHTFYLEDGYGGFFCGL